MRFSSFCKHANVLLCAWVFIGAACSSSLDPNLDNRSCGADGQCVGGYVCSRDRVCVRKSRSASQERVVTDGGTSSDGLALDSDAAAIEPAGNRSATRGTAGAAGSSETASRGGAASAAPSGPNSGAGSPAPPSAAAGSMSTAGVSGASAAAGAPSPSAAAGRGAMPPLSCAAGLELCSAKCVDLATDTQHCGKCGKSCNDKRTCVSGACEKASDATAPKNDVAALATILALFGLELSDLADSLGVDEDELDTTEVTLADLAALGIDEAALGLLGFTIDALGLIGIDVDLAS